MGFMLELTFCIQLIFMVTGVLLPWVILRNPINRKKSNNLKGRGYVYWLRVPFCFIFQPEKFSFIPVCAAQNVISYVFSYNAF